MEACDHASLALAGTTGELHGRIPLDGHAILPCSPA